MVIGLLIFHIILVIPYVTFIILGIPTIITFPVIGLLINVVIPYVTFTVLGIPNIIVFMVIGLLSISTILVIHCVSIIILRMISRNFMLLAMVHITAKIL